MKKRSYPVPLAERPHGRRGPKPRGLGLLVGVRIHPPQLDALDAWIAARPDLKASRPEAIRRLLEKALKK
jgi:hypothetical protein